MLKPLTLSLSLVVAFGASSLSFAGHHDAVPSGQCEAPTAQCALPSGQGGCGDICAPKKKCSLGLGNLFKHKPKCYTYEWVLKKKRVWGHHGGNNCNTCDSCGDATYPTGQILGSPQAAPAPQAAYGASQASYGAGQAAPAAVEAPPAPATEAPAAPSTPPAAPAAPTASNGGLLFLSPAGN